MCHCGNTGLERTPNKSQHKKLTVEKKILLPLLPEFELATFRSRVRRSYQQTIPAPVAEAEEKHAALFLFVCLFSRFVLFLCRYRFVSGGADRRRVAHLSSCNGLFQCISHCLALRSPHTQTVDRLSELAS